MTNNQIHESGADFLPAVRRARFDKLTIFEVSEAELDILEKGSPDSIYLNFAIFLLSMAVSFIVALFTTEVKSMAIFVVFVLLAIVGCLGGFFLLIMWLRDRSSVSKCAKTIRSRLLPAEGIQEETLGVAN